MIKIGCHDIKIVFKELENDNGQFDWETNTITLSSKIPPDQAFSAFIHECLHVCNSTLDSDTLGHALLDSLAEQIAQVLWENQIVDKVWVNSLTKPDNMSH